MNTPRRAVSEPVIKLIHAAITAATILTYHGIVVLQVTIMKWVCCKHSGTRTPPRRAFECLDSCLCWPQIEMQNDRGELEHVDPEKTRKQPPECLPLPPGHGTKLRFGAGQSGALGQARLQELMTRGGGSGTMRLAICYTIKKHTCLKSMSKYVWICRARSTMRFRCLLFWYLRLASEHL